MVSDQGLEIRFGGEQTNFLSILLRGRAFRQSKDYWDGNWLLVTATVHAGKFSGEIPGMIRAEELRDFVSDLVQLYQSLNSTVLFATFEGWLKFELEADKLGHILITGSIRDDVGSDNVLTFTLKSDQTFLSQTLKQLQQVTERYPVFGKP